MGEAAAIVGGAAVIVEEAEVVVEHRTATKRFARALRSTKKISLGYHVDEAYFWWFRGLKLNNIH